MIWMEILRKVNDQRNITQIYKQLKYTMKTIRDNITKLEKIGLITKTRTGRTKIIKITEKGLEVLKTIDWKVF